TPTANTLPDVDYLLRSWKAITGTDLKFKVYIARYSHELVPVSSNTDIIDDESINIFAGPNGSFVQISNTIIELIAPSFPMEYITYDLKTSNTDGMLYGDKVYSVQP